MRCVDVRGCTIGVPEGWEITTLSGRLHPSFKVLSTEHLGWVSVEEVKYPKTMPMINSFKAVIKPISKVELINQKGIPVALHVRAYAFLIENGKVVHNDAQRLETRIRGMSAYYDECFSLACFAWECQEFDHISNE